MGVKTWMLVYADGDVGKVLRGGPQMDRDATLKLARRLFPREKLERIGDGDLSSTCPPDDELHMGCFPEVSILAAKEFGIDYPSRLPKTLLSFGGTGTVYLHAMHSAVDWLAFAKWTGGELIRSLSLSPTEALWKTSARGCRLKRLSGQAHTPLPGTKRMSFPFIRSSWARPR